jgi:hypothetical protein
VTTDAVTRIEDARLIAEAIVAGAPIVENRYLENRIVLIRLPGRGPVVYAGELGLAKIRSAVDRLRKR